ncbi:MAG: PadR family transcriptional regulator [Candidatus Thorarchaeota archaeon]
MRLFLPTSGKVTPIHTVIMVQLLEKPRYGYEILRNLRDDFEGVWIPKTGTVYPALNSLVKKGLIEKETIEDKTYYNLTDSGQSLMDEMSDYVAEYILFNTRFIKSTVTRLPADFTQQVFYKIHSSGVEEILPEATIVEAIRRLSDSSLARVFLEARKQVLKDKLALVEHNLREMEQ